MRRTKNVKNLFEPTALCCVLLLAGLSTTAIAQSNDFTVSALLNAAAPARDMAQDDRPNVLFIIAEVDMRIFF